MNIQLIKVIVVIALLIVSAAIATPPGRLPLALRGVYKIVRKDLGAPTSDDVSAKQVSNGRKLLSFIIVVIAAIIALI